jgi:hypothetical protein
MTYISLAKSERVKQFMIFEVLARTAVRVEPYIATI